jgi:hypothetical protein
MLDSCISIDQKVPCHGEVVERSEEAYVLKEGIPGKTIELLTVYSVKYGGDSCAYTKGMACHGAESDGSMVTVVGHIFKEEN